VTEAPLRDVVRVFESTGPRGGRELVHVLECGCWVVNRRQIPAKRVRCIGCRIREEQAGGPHHGAPRVEDIAWQAFQAGILSGVQRHELAADDAAGTGIGRANTAFRGWWAKR
jgi:hypothetical protein